MSVSDEKKSIRKSMSRRRNDLSEKYIKETEDLSIPVIMDFLRSVERDVLPAGSGSRALRVMSYMSYRNEFPTHALNERILKENMQLILPFTDRDFNIIPCMVNDLASLSISSLGIAQPDPDTCPRASADDMDVILLPGLAFDRQGNRLGFGKGCYDRLLAGMAASPVTAGLAYDFQILDNLPCQETDMPCDFIITGREILKTGGAL